MRGIPAHAAGMRVGLYGGSFNPPHAAHLMMSKAALRKLGLNRVWWLVSPGNPLKPDAKLPGLDARLALCRDLIDDTRIIPTAAESHLGTRYTIDTLRALQTRCPQVRFVWLMGGDNLATFDQWLQWYDIAQTVPFAVFDRPGFSNRAIRGRAATALAPYRVDESDAQDLSGLAPPAWTLLHGPRSSLSSTELRAKTSSR